MKKCGDINHTFACFFHLLVCLVCLVCSSFASLSVSSLLSSSHSVPLYYSFTKTFVFVKQETTGWLQLQHRLLPYLISQSRESSLFVLVVDEERERVAERTSWESIMAWILNVDLYPSYVLIWEGKGIALSFPCYIRLTLPLFLSSPLSLFLLWIDTDLLDS